MVVEFGVCALKELLKVVSGAVSRMRVGLRTVKVRRNQKQKGQNAHTADAPR
jgi:hypothetical protein